MKIACPDRAFSSSGFGILENVEKAAGMYRSNFLSGNFSSHYEGVVLKDEMIAGMAFFFRLFFWTWVSRISLYNPLDNEQLGREKAGYAF